MIRIFWCFLLIVSCISCARKGSPSGGPRDIAPPLFLRASPDTLASQVATNIKEIRIDFDEYINLKDAQKQIIISPPLDRYPLIYPIPSKPRKYILIKLEDSLKSNTTYTINFGESIEDLNEGNKLPLFNYVFSTGKYIDSLKVKGKVKQALSNEKNLNTVLALYKQDSLEVNLMEKPYYITKIDSAGSFQFNYLHQGNYRLVAFTDDNENLRYDPDESLGFTDSLIQTQEQGQYNLVLSENKSDFKSLNATQTAEGELLFTFQGKPQSIEIAPVKSDILEDFSMKHLPYSDSAFVYFNNKKIKTEDNKERISFSVQQTHSADIDTVSILYNKKMETTPRVKLIPNNYAPGKKVLLESSLALQGMNPDSITVFKDSTAIEFKAQIDSLNWKKMQLDFPIEFEKEYTVQLFPGATQDFMLQTQDSLSFSFKTPKANELGNLIIQLQNAPKTPFFIQLLAKDKVVQSVYGTSTEFEFKHLQPKEYSLRILIDENNNGVWDMADFKNNIQAEKTYIYPKLILVRAFWDITETWQLN